MKVNNKYIIAAFVLLAGYVFWDFKSEVKTNEKKAAELAVLNLKQDQVEKIEIQNGKENILLQRTIDGWMLQQPTQDEADSTFVEDFLQSSFSEPAKDSIQAEAADFNWQIYGLADSKLKIKFTDTSGKSDELQISEVKNFEKNIFARANQEKKVYILPATWLGRVSRISQDFKDRRLYRGGISAIKGVKYQKSATRHELLLNSDRWTWAGHEKIKLDQNAVREFLTQINETKFQSFELNQKFELKSQGKDLAKIQMEFVLESRKWKADLIQRQDRKIEVLVQDSKYPKLFVGQLEPANFSKFLNLNPADFRDRNEAFVFDKTKVTQIQIQNSLKKFTLKNIDSKWQVPDDQKTQVEQKAVLNLLDKLSSSKVVEFRVPEKLAAKMTDSIQLLDSQSKLLLSLTWGARFNLVTDAGEKQLIKMSSSAFDQPFAMDEASIGLWGLTKLVQNQQNKEIEQSK